MVCKAKCFSIYKAVFHSFVSIFCHEEVQFINLSQSRLSEKVALGGRRVSSQTTVSGSPLLHRDDPTRAVGGRYKWGEFGPGA